MSMIRHTLRLLLLALLGLSALSVKAQVYASSASSFGLRNDELLPPGKLILRRLACAQAGHPRSLTL